MDSLACRFCGSRRTVKFLDLGRLPLANAFPRDDEPAVPEETHPLDAHFCGECGIVQIGRTIDPTKLFSRYVYFSSTAASTVEHGFRIARSLKQRCGLSDDSFVVEVGSNDGTVLDCFRKTGCRRLLGVDPAAGPAGAAAAAGIETVVDFFGKALGERIRDERGPADLILCRNVFGHVPDPHDFVEGLAALLAPSGTAAVESPYMPATIARTEFDTFYHEHVFHCSVRPMALIFAAHGMDVLDAEFNEMHGGSMIYYARRAGRALPSAGMAAFVEREKREFGDPAVFFRFAERSRRLAGDFAETLRRLRDGGRSVAAYGAAAKGATLLCVAGVGRETIEYVADKSPHKQGLRMPGTRIPVRTIEFHRERRPDATVLLAWNCLDEIRRQERAYLEGGGVFIVPVPSVRTIGGGTERGRAAATAAGGSA